MNSCARITVSQADADTGGGRAARPRKICNKKEREERKEEKGKKREEGRKKREKRERKGNKREKT